MASGDGAEGTRPASELAVELAVRADINEQYDSMVAFVRIEYPHIKTGVDGTNTGPLSLQRMVAKRRCERVGNEYSKRFIDGIPRFRRELSVALDVLLSGNNAHYSAFSHSACR